MHRPLFRRKVAGGLALVAVSQATPVTSTTLSINTPAGTVDGDLMVAITVGANSSGAWSGPGGWTERTEAAGTFPRFAMYTKVAASEGSSHSFTQSVSQQVNGVILTFRRATYDTHASATTNTPTVTLTSVSPSAAALLIALVGTNAANSPSVPSGMTGVVSSTSAPGYQVSFQTVSAGATGTRSSTLASAYVGGCLLAIRQS